MRILIHRILVKLGLRPEVILYRGALPEEYEHIGWKFTSHYGLMNNKDFIVRGEIVDE